MSRLNIHRRWNPTIKRIRWFQDTHEPHDYPRRAFSEYSVYYMKCPDHYHMRGGFELEFKFKEYKISVPGKYHLNNKGGGVV